MLSTHSDVSGALRHSPGRTSKPLQLKGELCRLGWLQTLMHVMAKSHLKAQRTANVVAQFRRVAQVFITVQVDPVQRVPGGSDGCRSITTAAVPFALAANTGNSVRLAFLDVVTQLAQVFAILPLVSHKAKLTPESALLSVGPLRQYAFLGTTYHKSSMAVTNPPSRGGFKYFSIRRLSFQSNCRPPLRSSTSPVMKPLIGWARNSTQWANSSSSQKRPTGILRRISA